MDELEISGKRYISAARAAKEHKYHSDYIGQLVRGGKVVGQKVGRAWYVDADSLAEYLGKEVPPRGPMVREVKSEPVIEKVEIVTEEESVGSGEKSAPFVMQLRKSGRSHVIEALGNTQVAPTKEIEVENKIVEPVVEVPEVVAPEVFTEEETYIPLKITKEPVQLYNEPEDSFYKVSRKGLRYVKNAEPKVAPVMEQARVYATTKKTKSTTNASTAAKALSMVLVAGILSLGVGVLMSYYLHSITTVEEAGQTSSVILSN